MRSVVSNVDRDHAMNQPESNRTVLPINLDKAVPGYSLGVLDTSSRSGPRVLYYDVKPEQNLTRCEKWLPRSDHVYSSYVVYATSTAKLEGTHRCLNSRIGPPDLIYRLLIGESLQCELDCVVTISQRMMQVQHKRNDDSSTGMEQVAG